MTKKKHEVDQIAYNQGVMAARNGISREEAPHAEDSSQLVDWFAGYDFVKPQAEKKA